MFNHNFQLSTDIVSDLMKRWDFLLQQEKKKHFSANCMDKLCYPFYSNNCSYFTLILQLFLVILHSFNIYFSVILLLVYRYFTVILQSFYRYFMVILRLFYSYFTVISQLFYRYFTDILQLFFSYFTVILHLFYSYFTGILQLGTLQLFYNCFAVILQLFYSYFAVNYIYFPIIFQLFF